MPAKSKAQHKLFSMALAYKKGEFKGEPSEEVKKLSKLPMQSLEDYAKTKEEGLPDHVEESLWFMNCTTMDHITNEDKDKLSGGLSDNMSLEDIAKKHGVQLKHLEDQLEMGMKVESEHTPDKELQKEIAMDHLFEDPNYYTKLKKVETNESSKLPTFNEFVNENSLEQKEIDLKKKEELLDHLIHKSKMPKDKQHGYHVRRIKDEIEKLKEEIKTLKSTNESLSHTNVSKEYKDILDGAGWASDNYILNFSNLSKQEKYALMLRLAQKGVLFDEDKMSDDDLESDDKPSHGKMSVNDVKSLHSKLMESTSTASLTSVNGMGSTSFPTNSSTGSGDIAYQLPYNSPKKKRKKSGFKTFEEHIKDKNDKSQYSVDVDKLKEIQKDIKNDKSIGNHTREFQIKYLNAIIKDAKANKLDKDDAYYASTLIKKYSK